MVQTVHDLLAAVRPHERAPADRPFVYVNVIETLDGHVAIDGSSHGLGDEADLQMLLDLRSISDAVLIGTGTLRAEGYARLVRNDERRATRRAAGLADDPLAVLISRRFDIPWEAGLFQAPEQPVLVYTAAPGPVPGVPAPVEVIALPDPSPTAVLADLRARGARALLCESGPTLSRALVAAAVVDELFLTLAPVLTGDESEPPILAGGQLPQIVGLELLWVRQAGSQLLLRYALEPTPAAG
jgi:riboflavin-specific deaminase-like protein